VTDFSLFSAGPAVIWLKSSLAEGRGNNRNLQWDCISLVYVLYF